MRSVSFGCLAASFGSMGCAAFGYLWGDPHAFLGSAILSWIFLAGVLALMGILSAMLSER